MDGANRLVKFGWIVPAGGTKDGGMVPGIIGQQEAVLPDVAEHFDSMWVFDHLIGFADRDEPYLECWTTLTWLAARYPGVQVGSLVMAASFRYPPLLAKMGATLHALSGGRFVLGIGAGWRAEEYAAYGYPYPATPVRIRQLDEAVQLIYRMWVEKSPTIDGRYFKAEGANCSPRPAPPPPIMIGGTGERLMLPLIARLADWWSVPPIKIEDYRRKRDLLHKHMRATGRNPSEMVQTFAKYGCTLPHSQEDSRRWIAELQPLVDLGVTHFMLECGEVTDPTLVERFAEEVIGPLNRG